MVSKAAAVVPPRPAGQQPCVIKLVVFLGRQLGVAAIQEKLKSIQVPDFAGKERVSGIGKVEYRLSK